jgi:hypothetical protein
MPHSHVFPKSGMDDGLIAEIKAYLQDHPPPELAADAILSVEDFRQLGHTPRILFPTASKNDVAKAEADLGFPLPHLLKKIYSEISNGIAGFSYDIMGLESGCASDSGTLVDAYISFKEGSDGQTNSWKTGLLPFCDWGCAIYSCVDCTESAYPILTYEDSGAWAEQYTLPEFFEMWLKGKVLFSQENVEVVTYEGINPFTREKMTYRGRRRRKPAT